jgi:hypothetical protein
MVNKRGLSQVVTTVLIILIVLAAVVIIWAFIRPVLTQAGEQITTDCFTLNLEVISCETGVFNDNVTVRRNAGTGDLQGIRLILSNGSVSNQEPLEELEFATFSVGPGAEISSANVISLVGDNLRACEPQHEEVICKVFP